MIRFVPMRRTAWVALAALTLAMPASAQRGSGNTVDHTEALLHERNRSAMHPGDPLKIVGLEQGGNNIRASTPMLEQSDRVAAMVNPDENYRRTIAMYEDGATFQQPLAMLSPAPTTSDATPAIGHVRGGQVANDASSSDWPWVLVLALIAFLMYWMQRRSNRGAPANGMGGSA